MRIDSELRTERVKLQSPIGDMCEYCGKHLETGKYCTIVVNKDESRFIDTGVDLMEKIHRVKAENGEMTREEGKEGNMLCFLNAEMQHLAIRLNIYCSEKCCKEDKQL